MLKLLSSILLLFAVPAAAQVHHHDGASESVDRFYSRWMIPPSREASCCNKRDCYATEAHNQNGIWYARRREDGEWVPIPAKLVEQNQVDPRESPDGLTHVCMTPPEASSQKVFCFTLGSMI